MATPGKVDITCANCNTQSEHAVRVPASDEHSHSAPDLDLRPAPERRHVMNTAIRECPTCKLICPELASPPSGFKEALAHPEYQALVADKKVPDQVRKFRAWAFIAEKSGLVADAGFAHLHAAWVADDAKDKGLADVQRHMAVVRLSTARDQGKVYPRQKGGAEALLSDIYRRTGNWDEAVHEAERGKSITDQDFVAALCDLEISLARKHDADVHTTEEVR